ncbi:MAG TPA: endolytic transglycosylase MltG [Nitrospirota bacterium]|nr:endolytic transglycosylase MltG [Nitrospirota bacterium]
MSRGRLIFSAFMLIFLIAISLTLAFAFFLVSPADKHGTEQIFVVKEGESLKEVAEQLERARLITSTNLFVLWAKLTGRSRQVKTGEYSLSAGMAPIKILEKISKGPVVLHTITIPEGFSMEQIADLLASKGLVQKQLFLRLAQNPKTLGAYGVKASTLEGYLFPDTYHFSRGLDPSTLIDTMVKRFWQMVGPLRERADAIGMKLEDVVILASIVEKETGDSAERPAIASVFLNRLRQGMRLESDPTVIYGLKDFDGNLRKHDLTRETPYNTYVIKGLTPGPIASPGLDAIKAVLYPAQTEYFYFVSKNDGSHHFSKTLAEHNRAVELYQKKKGMRQEKTS